MVALLTDDFRLTKIGCGECKTGIYDKDGNFEDEAPEGHAKFVEETFCGTCPRFLIQEEMPKDFFDMWNLYTFCKNFNIFPMSGGVFDQFRHHVVYFQLFARTLEEVRNKNG